MACIALVNDEGQRDVTGLNVDMFRLSNLSACLRLSMSEGNKLKLHQRSLTKLINHTTRAILTRNENARMRINQRAIAEFADTRITLRTTVNGQRMADTVSRVRKVDTGRKAVNQRNTTNLNERGKGRILRILRI